MFDKPTRPHPHSQPTLENTAFIVYNIFRYAGSGPQNNPIRRLKAAKNNMIRSRRAAKNKEKVYSDERSIIKRTFQKHKRL